MTHYNHHDSGNIWISIIGFVSGYLAKITGFINWVEIKLNIDVPIPNHDIWWLPSWSELIPAVIVAIITASIAYFVGEFWKWVRKKYVAWKN